MLFLVEQNNLYMKKILTILGCVILFAASSCTKQYVSPATTNQTYLYDVPASEWALTTDQSSVASYQASISVDALSSDAAKYAGVLVAISYDGGATYEQLPEVYAGISYSYTYNAGNVSIYAQSSDGSAAVKPTLPVRVKVILVDSNAN